MSSIEKNPQAGQGRPLPRKDQDLFRQVVRQYETKQYKKGIKSADAILKKFPNHGETLCMKGLILHNMGASSKDKKEEAISLVKKGLMSDMRSHVCWHVYGLIYRSERNYPEAIKAYKQALRIDPNSLQILRDLSLLQIQIRDLSGFAQTRHAILELKPDQKSNWLTFALSKHLLHHIDEAINIIDIYLDTLRQPGSDVESNHPEFQCNYESSELALYKNLLLCEKQESSHKNNDNDNDNDRNNIYKEPYEHLLSIQHLIKDKYTFLQNKAKYELYLGQFQDAKRTYLQLFDTYGATEDYSVHSGYMCALLQLDFRTISSFYSLSKHPSTNKIVNGARTLATILPLSQDQKDVLYNDYTSNLLQAYPKSHTTRRIPLTLLHYESKEWKDQIQTYIQRQLKRGVPSLGSDLASLFLLEKNVNDLVGSDCATVTDGIEKIYVIASDPSDIQSHAIYQCISDLVDECIKSLETHSIFATKGTNTDEHNIEAPSTLLWTWYLRAVLYDLTAEYSKGIEYTNKCLEQTPTAVDVYELQGKLYHHAGDIEKAMSSTNEGRILDKQDRYINNQTVKYMVQAGKEKEALETIALFTRHESDPDQNIFEMQCYWYEMELGKSLQKKGQFGKALKRFVAIEKHFEDFNEDQFDFHSYCIRKVTLRAYVSVLRWEDSLWGHDVYADAAEGIIETYLKLYDNPPNALDEDSNGEPDYSKMTPADRKKAKALARKKKKKAEKKANAEATEKKDNNKDGSNKKKDEDPNGLELLKLDPLDQAKKYSSTLVKNAPNRLSTWLYQYDVAIRRKKYCIALRSLKKAMKLASHNDNEGVFSRMVEFAKLDTTSLYDNAHVQSVFDDEKLTLYNGLSWNDFIINVVENVNTSSSSASASASSNLPHRIAVVKAMMNENIGSVNDAYAMITGRGLKVGGVTLTSCRESIEVLKSLDGDNDDDELSRIRNDWIALVKSRFYLE